MEAASALLTAHEGNAAMTQGHSLKRNIFLRELEKRRAAAAPGRNDKVGDDPDSDDGEWLYGSEARDNEIHAAAAAEGARVCAAKVAEADKEAAARESASRMQHFSVARALQRMTKEQQRKDREAMPQASPLRTVDSLSRREARGASPLQKDGDVEGFGGGDDDDDDATGGAGGKNMPQASPLRTVEDGRAGGFLDAEMDDLRRSEARGASPLQKDDDDTGNSEPSADAETPGDWPALSSGLSGKDPGSSKRKRKAEKNNRKRAKKAKAVRTSERLAAADNDGIPVQSTSKYRAVNGKGALVCGSKNTCQCDAVAMALNSLGIQLPRFAARNWMMSTWRSDAEATGPGMDVALAFYKMHGYVARADGGLCSNPLALLRRTNGTYHLETLLTLLGDDGKVALGGDNKPIERKHAAVFVASEPWSECGEIGVGVLKDNQSDVKPVCITSSDREDKAGALEAFKLLWPNHRMMLINAYEVTAI